MKRVGNLWGELTSFDNLFRAAKRAAAGKRTRPDVAGFLHELEWQMVGLRRELLEGEYRPGPYRTFLVREPKPRKISAAPFRDRVVHHALTQMLEPIWERRFSKDSYACRKGLGTHAALARAREGARRYRYALKCDIRKYFASIDHGILNEQLERVVKCRPTLRLAAAIIEGSNPQEPVNAYFTGDGLFEPFERRRGLPLGNQTSQFFANVYLNPLDHFVNRVLKPSVYVRYVDDFVLFGDSRSGLRDMLVEIEERLEMLRLRVHQGKSRVYQAAAGVTFLGWRIFPDRARLARGNVQRFRRRLAWMREEHDAGRMRWEDMDMRVRAWIAHAAHGETWKLREQVFGRVAFRRARSLERRLVEQRCQEPALRVPQQQRA